MEPEAMAGEVPFSSVEAWEAQVPEAVRGDPLWRMKAYETVW
jgi:hypothetical protein